MLLISDCNCLFDYRQNVALSYNNDFLAFYLEFAAAVLGKQNFVAGLDLHDDFLAVQISAGTYGYDLGYFALFLSGARQEKLPLFSSFSSIILTTTLSNNGFNFIYKVSFSSYF